MMGITMAHGEGLGDFEVILDPLTDRRQLLWCSMICKIQGECSTENSFSPYLYSYVSSDWEDPEDIKTSCLFF